MALAHPFNCQWTFRFFCIAVLLGLLLAPQSRAAEFHFGSSTLLGAMPFTLVSGTTAEIVNTNAFRIFEYQQESLCTYFGARVDANSQSVVLSTLVGAQGFLPFGLTIAELSQSMQVTVAPSAGEVPGQPVPVYAHYRGVGVGSPISSAGDQWLTANAWANGEQYTEFGDYLVTNFGLPLVIGDDIGIDLQASAFPAPPNAVSASLLLELSFNPTTSLVAHVLPACVGFGDGPSTDLHMPVGQVGSGWLFAGPGGWYDPPASSAFDYHTLNGTLFSDIASFPGGFGDAFHVAVDGVDLPGTFAAGSQVHFADYASILGNSLVRGVGVAAFTISGIENVVDNDSPLAFPLKLGFDQDHAQFVMTPHAVPEPSSLALLAAGVACLLIHRARRPVSASYRRL